VAVIMIVLIITMDVLNAYAINVLKVAVILSVTILLIA